MKLGFVLLPGAGMAGWLWKRLLPKLQQSALSIAPRLKVNTMETRMNAVFSDLVKYHVELIDGSGFDRVVLVGHSGAGLLAGAVAKVATKVKHVFFIAANIPRHRTTAIQVFPQETQKKFVETATEQAKFDEIPVKDLESLFVNHFCNTCTKEQMDYVLEQKFYPEPICVLTEKMDWENYPPTGKTYVVCTDDRTLTVKQQEYLASNLGITDLRRINSDHLVMISHAEELATELNEVAGHY